MMYELQQGIVQQVLAGLSTLQQTIAFCPDDEWQEDHGDAPFSQVVFHTLFYTDFYLQRGEESFKQQPYHDKHATMFRDYEELEFKKAEQLYTKEECMDYLDFCVEKVQKTIMEETLESLQGSSCISFREGSRLELYLYLVRHIQHHAAQLGLRIQFITGRELNWVSRGWKLRPEK